MAKTRSRIATGLKIPDIMGFSEEKLMSYTSTQQREIVSRLASAANKRLRNLERKGYETPASMRVEYSGGKISVKGKSGTELINEFNRAKRFLKSPSSTIKGWKKQVEKIEKELEGTEFEGVEITPDSSARAVIGNAFALYDIISENHPELVARREKYEILRHISEHIENKKPFNVILSDTINWLENEREAQQRLYDELQDETELGIPLYNDIPDRFKRR